MQLEEFKTKAKAILKEIIETTIFVIVMVILIRFFLGEIRWIPSGSMRPTLIEGDRIFVERISRFFESRKSDFYSTKGIEASYQFLFKLLFINSYLMQLSV